ncbi:MAG: LysR family transcriptional regulator [Firmicutes bacterium]|nr:LysR family transcriptional regulator [Bacillota bacterium]
MNINSIYYFLQVAEYRSYSTASRKLFVAQSSLSTMIKKLEEELSIKLFLYDGKALHLTTEGHRFYELAKSFYDSYEAFSLSAKQISDEVFGSLKIILPPLIAELYFSKPIAAFQRQYPDVQICVANRGGYISQNLILVNEFDLGVTIRPVIPNTFACTDIIQCPMVLAVHESNPLAAKPYVRYEDLADESFLSYEEDSVLYQRFMSKTAAAGYAPRIIAMAAESPFLLSMVEDNNGVMVIPKCVTDYRNFSNIKFIDIMGEETGYELVLIYKQDKPLSPAALTFVDFVKSWYTL